jgi:hypothetical protein
MYRFVLYLTCLYNLNARIDGSLRPILGYFDAHGSGHLDCKVNQRVRPVTFSCQHHGLLADGGDLDGRHGGAVGGEDGRDPHTIARQDLG